MLEQFVDAVVVMGIDRNPDTDADRNGVSFQIEFRGNRLGNAFRHHDDALFGCHAFQDDRELIPAHPRDGIHLTHATFQSFRDRFQQFISDVVPERIIDRLESIQVQQHKAQRLLEPFAPGHRLDQPIAEEAAVHETSELVILSEIG